MQHKNIDKIVLKIENWFKNYHGTITAFSGGIDSALVLFISRKFLGKEKAIGVISNSESLKQKDYQLALNFAKNFDIKLKTIYTNELADVNYYTNPSNRCYFCKTHLYNEIELVKKMYPEYIVLNGTNKDDFSDYRPGLKAADENSVKSPLAELGIGKSEIRTLAKHFGIPFFNKPASPCLSSRIPYGNVVSEKKLKQIEKAEAYLNNLGFDKVRVRHYNTFCKIEVPLSQIYALKEHFREVEKRIKKIGFEYCLIDDEGLISGKLNNVLNIKNV